MVVKRIYAKILVLDEEEFFMNKNRFTILTATGLLAVSIFASGFKFWWQNDVKIEPAKTVVSQSYESVKDKVWCITFQLVWNDFMDKVNYGKPILLAGGNPPIATELNKKSYSVKDLSEKSYYKKDGVISKKLKRQIEKDLKKKFNETSDILGMVDWTVKDAYLFYAMLKKDFQFATPFDKLAAAKFGTSEEKVNYFGIDTKSSNELRKNVDVLFYNSNEDYAVKLLTKQGEELILYKTNSQESFDNIFAYVIQQDKNADFGNEDSLKVPNIKIDKTLQYPELCGKRIKGTNKVISQAIQTIKFNLDNKGGSLKSEAALVTMKMSVGHIPPRAYNFDGDFVMFLKEAGKEKPYFATRINDLEFLDKE